MKLKTLLYTQKHILWMSVSVFIVVLLVLSLYNISRISNATALTNTVVCSMRSSSHEFHSISNLNETMLMYNNKYVFENDEKLESSIISLLKSCTDRNRRLVSQNDWQNIMSSYSFIMVSFRPPKCINTSVRSNLIIDAILVPLCDDNRWCNSVLVKSNESYFSSFIKYDPKIFSTITAMCKSL